MAAAITELLVALREWQTAVRQLRHQGKTPEERQRQLKTAEQKVLSRLAAAQVEAEINDLIQSATTSSNAADKLRSLLHQNPEAFLSVELDSIQPLGVSRTTLKKLIADYLNTPDEAQPLEDSEQLPQMFAKLSAAVLEEHQATIDLSRKPKKQRRRDLSLGTLQTAIGIGLVAGNTQMDSTIANSSYILGGNALLAALQNFVGRLEESIDKASSR